MTGRCQWCECIAAALSEVGLSPERVSCAQVFPHLLDCLVGCGTFTEGLPLAYVDAMTDKAIELCLAKVGDKP